MKRYLILFVTIALALASCQKYDAQIDSLQRQIDELVTASSKVNDNVEALTAMVEAIQASDEVVSFTPVSEGGKVVGYTVTFKNSGSVTVYNSTANVSVGEFEGKYYWMVGGKWLTDASGNKVEACRQGITPQFRITAGKIEVSLDNGASWSVVGDVGTPVIDDVIDGDDALVIVLSNGQRITLAKQKPLVLTLSTYSLTMGAGGGRTIGYEISGGNADTKVLTYAKDGWKASVRATDAASGLIDITSPVVASQSEVLVFVSDNAGRSVVSSVTVISTL